MNLRNKYIHTNVRSVVHNCECRNCFLVATSMFLVLGVIIFIAFANPILYGMVG